MNENSMAAYLHLLRSIDKLSDIDKETKIKSAYTLFKVVTQKELTKQEKLIVENKWENRRN